MTNARYLVRLWGLLAVYGILLVGSLTAFSHGLVPRWLDVPVSLVPMLPAGGILFAVMARYRAMDELDQRKLAEAIVFAFGATAVITFSYGFLENIAAAPRLSYFWVWAIMGAMWLVGAFLSYLRYR